MDRSVRVNAGSGSSANSGPARDAGWPSVNIHGQWETRPGPNPDPRIETSFEWPGSKAPAGGSATAADQGPCLYFGPAGQRCDRRATKDGFCWRHQAGAPAVSVPFLTPKKIAAFMVAIAMLWPELVKIVSALLRLLR